MARRGKSPVDARRAGTIEAALRRSLRAAVAGDLETAETWLERIVEADSSDLDAYHALARLYREQGAIGRAIRMHQNLLLRKDLSKAQRIDASLELARDFDRGGFSARAIASYEEVLGSEPRNAEALERLVTLLHASRAYPRALALVKKWRRLDRAGADAAEVAILLSQAQSQIEEGDHDGARSTLKRCLRRDKTVGRAWELLGELEVERGRNARAVEAFRKGALADPEVAPQLYPKLDAGYAALGKVRDFEKLLRGILEERPADAPARRALARSLAGRGEIAEAIECLSRALELAPTEFALHVELGRQLLAEGQDGESLKAYASLLDALERENALRPQSAALESDVRALDAPGDGERPA